LAIVQALLGLYPFKQLYIADLDAIQKRGNHLHSISAIQAKHPYLEIWLDAGISHKNDFLAWQDLSITWVIGSENLHCIYDYLNLKQVCGKGHILSLDFTVDGYQGPTELLQSITHWPEAVIAMTLKRVGSTLGPDFELLSDLVSLNSVVNIYAAGGLRQTSDIKQLANLGVSGALVASALHGGEITGTDLHGIKKPDINRA
jgi:phosphoribosylformimino-5-aminoimidazole carboxamide ribotide isomerase